MKEKHLHILQQTIVDRAESIGLSALINPPELLKPLAPIATLMNKNSDDPLSQSITTPQALQMCAIQINNYSIILASLSNAELNNADIRHYYTHAARIRGQLGMRDTDLYLFLIAPAGAKDDEVWQRLANSIERDESICRKLVWLPSTREELDALLVEANQFCDRTFLAIPWASDQEFAPHDLDAVNAIFENLRIEFTKTTGLSADVLRRWLRILEKEDPQRTAQALFDASRGKP